MVSRASEKSVKGKGLGHLAATAAELLRLSANHKVWLLEGSMGAGKTTLIKELCRQLGVTDNVTSPTFSLINEYASPLGPVYHFDFYRVKDLEEALQAGVEAYFYSGQYCFIEWPGIIRPVLPPAYLMIAIEAGQGEARNYKLRFYDNI